MRLFRRRGLHGSRNLCSSNNDFSRHLNLVNQSKLTVSYNTISRSLATQNKHVKICRITKSQNVQRTFIIFKTGNTCAVCNRLVKHFNIINHIRFRKLLEHSIIHVLIKKNKTHSRGRLFHKARIKKLYRT